MYSSLRARLFVALSLTCAVTSASCKKSDEAKADVEDEGTKKKKPKPEPPPKKKKEWVPKHADFGSCPTAVFCTTAPDISAKSDAGKYHAECGAAAKIPTSLEAIKGMGGRDASLNPTYTKEAREDGDEPDACCYSYRIGPCGKGRPLREAGALVLASEVARDDWSTAMELRLDSVSAPERSALIAHIRSIALLEHASVAAFARVSLELLTLGAPAELVDGAHRAALDEIRHAKLCWSVLAALDGEQRGPSPMTIPGAHATDPEAILVATVIEGCVGETLGSLLFAEAARQCTVPSLARVYATIADEEAEHAALAFRIVQFLAEGEPSRIGRALAAAASAERTESDVPSIPSLGLLDRATQRDVLDRGYREVVLPTLSAMRPTALRSGSRDARADGDTSETSRAPA